MNKLFDNTEKAFVLKSDSQLDKAYFLFKLIANEPVMRIGTAVTRFAVKAHLPVEGLIRATVFDHFCGGIDEKDCMPLIDRMFENGVSSILDYSVEGKERENQFDFAKNKILEVIGFAKEKQAIPFAVFKPTAFGRFELYQKVSDGIVLDKNERLEWENIERRFHEVCAKAKELDVAILIDAEESWIQGAADDLAFGMMKVYNQEKVIVYNTAQMYRWDRFDYIKILADKAKKGRFRIGIKLVRGAYMEKENERAILNGYKSPICETKQSTDLNFDDALTFMVNNLDLFSIFLGTHNESSTYKLLELMEKNNIDYQDPRVWFGQLYGMSDNITYNLANTGYLVAKYLPYGPVRDVMPYLIRRAEENTSVAGQTTRELFLIKKEIDRRRTLNPS